MENEPAANSTKGRLRAEDRRGKGGDEYLNHIPQENAPSDPEQYWENDQTGKLSHKIMAGFVAVALIGTLGFFASSLQNKPNNHSENQEKKTSPPPPSPFNEKSTSAEITQAIEACVRGFMNATSNQERCRFIIGGDQLVSTLDEYYRRPGVQPPKSFSRIYQTDLAAFGGVPMQAVMALDKKETTAWIFNILPTQDDMKIDWESSVSYGQCSWEDFQTTKPITPTTMRVYLARSGIKDQSADPEKFGFCKIYFRGEEGSLPAFFPINTPLASNLKKIVPPGGRQPVKVKLRWNPEGTAVELLELHHNFWVDLEFYQREFVTHSK